MSFMEQAAFPQARKHLEKIHAYSAGKTAKDLNKKKVNMIKLSSNESTWGPSEDAMNAMKRAVNSVNLYPPSQSEELKGLLAKFSHVLPENIVIGNGSNEVIQFIILAYVSPREHVLIPEPTFSMYQIYSQIMNVRVRTVPNREDHSIDLSVLKKKITSRTRVIFLANPNNPSGLIVDKMELELFLMGLQKNILVVIDEAYADFCDSDLKPDFSAMIRCNRYPNLIVTRTFSKAFGMAGLRLGYGLCHKHVIEMLRKMGQHFNVNSMAVAAATASLENLSHYREVVEQVKVGRRYLEQKLWEMGIFYLPSKANFLMIRTGDGKRAFDDLGERGIIVRELSSFGLPEYIRVTVSNMEHNKKVINAVQELRWINKVNHECPVKK
jgi:histidinol-phosphate aminotransferase